MSTSPFASLRLQSLLPQRTTPHRNCNRHPLAFSDCVCSVMTMADRTTRRVYSAEQLHKLRGSFSAPKLREAIEEHDGEDAELVKGTSLPFFPPAPPPPQSLPPVSPHCTSASGGAADQQRAWHRAIHPSRSLKTTSHAFDTSIPYCHCHSHCHPHCAPCRGYLESRASLSTKNGWRVFSRLRRRNINTRVAFR
jgi:hypothetical protein